MSDPTGLNTKTTTVISRLSSIQGAINAFRQEQSTVPGSLLDILTELQGSFEEIKTAIAGLQDAIGVPNQSNGSTLMSLTYELAQHAGCMPIACSPGALDPGGCVEPLISTGQVASSDYGGRTFAVWNYETLPNGLSFGSFLEFPVANAELVHEANGIWKAFVKSTGSPTFSISPDLDTLYPTNTWVSVSANLDMAFNTPTGTDITVYLCAPGDLPFTECVELNSVSTHMVRTINGTADLSFDAQTIPLYALQSQNLNVDMVYQDFGTVIWTLSGAPKVVTNDWLGYRVEWIAGDEGSACSIEYVTSTGAHQVTNIGTVGQQFTIPASTVYLFISNRPAASPSGAAFTVRICPPIPE